MPATCAVWRPAVNLQHVLLASAFASTLLPRPPAVTMPILHTDHAELWCVKILLLLQLLPPVRAGRRAALKPLPGSRPRLWPMLPSASQTLLLVWTATLAVWRLGRPLWLPRMFPIPARIPGPLTPLKFPLANTD